MKKFLWLALALAGAAAAAALWKKEPEEPGFTAAFRFVTPDDIHALRLEYAPRRGSTFVVEAGNRDGSPLRSGKLRCPCAGLPQPITLEVFVMDAQGREFRCAPPLTLTPNDGQTCLIVLSGSYQDGFTASWS